MKEKERVQSTARDPKILAAAILASWIGSAAVVGYFMKKFEPESAKASATPVRIFDREDYTLEKIGNNLIVEEGIKELAESSVRNF